MVKFTGFLALGRVRRAHSPLNRGGRARRGCGAPGVFVKVLHVENINRTAPQFPTLGGCVRLTTVLAASTVPEV